MNVEQITSEVQSFTSWEDKYRFIIGLSKVLPAMDEKLKQQGLEIAGCESQVWLSWQKTNGVYHFQADSNARILKGLIVLVLAAVEGKTQAEIASFDFEHYFQQLDLLPHLTATRSEGVAAIVRAIKALG